MNFSHASKMENGASPSTKSTSPLVFTGNPLSILSNSFSGVLFLLPIVVLVTHVALSCGNLTAGDPSVLWTRYVPLTQIESAFRSLKSELGMRPIYHQLEHRADTHILIAFLAYCLQVTLKHRLLLHAPGLTPAAVLEKLAEIKMIDVWIPTVDQRWLILPRCTQPSADTGLLIEKLRLGLPSQPPPRLVSQKESNEIEVQPVRWGGRLW
jgi:hypothetical protein